MILWSYMKKRKIIKIRDKRRCSYIQKIILESHRATIISIYNEHDRHNDIWEIIIHLALLYG